MPEVNHKVNRGKSGTRPEVSAVLEDGTIVEMLYQPEQQRTLFCIGFGGEIRFAPDVRVGGRRLVPYSVENNLLKNEVVLFASSAEEYGTEADLVARVQQFIHRYVDVSPLFERVASYYVLLTWVYDCFNELPYLRLLGDPGSGKTRFLLTVGALCYKPIFASGASTVSPIFRLLDSLRGTLIVDEADFRFSDQTAEIIKILNNGNGRGFSVLRSEATGSSGKEFDPRAYAVFGPKIVATRARFQDYALETRCITEEMGRRPLRSDIPINLPSGYKAEALLLRNQLLMFRLRHAGRPIHALAPVDPSIEPRLKQVFAPLLTIVSDEQTRQDLLALARQYNGDLIAERGQESEAKVLEVIRDLLEARTSLAIKEITVAFSMKYADEYERKITPKWIGYLVRRRLHLPTLKRHGIFVVPDDARTLLPPLFERYGVEPVPAALSGPSSPTGDLGDVARG